MIQALNTTTDSNKRLQLDWNRLARMDLLLVEISNDQKIVRCTPSLASLLDKTAEELVGLSCKELFCPGVKPEQGCFCLDEFKGSNDFASRQFVLRDATGQPHLLSGQSLANNKGAYLLLQDKTARIHTERQLVHHEKQSELLSRISHRLISISADQVDEGINYALAELGQFLEVDRSYLFRCDDEQKTVSNSHEWTSDGILPEFGSLQQMSVSELPWFWPRISSGQPVVVNKTADLDVDAVVEREHWQRQQIESLLVVPLSGGEMIGGFIGVDAVAQCRSWQTTDLQLLTMVADLIGSLVARRHSRVALQNSDRRFAALSDAVPALIWETDAGGELCYGNRHWKDFTGWEPGQGHRGWEAFVHVEDLARMTIKSDACLTEGRLFSLELRLRRADGEYRWMEMNGAPLNDSKSICGMIGSAFDITDHKMAEEQLLTLNESLELRVMERTSALQNLNNELRTLTQAIEQSPCSIVITDVDGGIEYVNPKFTQMTGYSPDEAMGQNPRVLKGEDGHTDYQLLWQTLTAGEEWRGEFHNRRKNGEYFWEMASISPICDEDGTVRHYLAVKEDITARKQLEQAVLNERDDLQNAQQELQRAYDELKSTQSQMLQQEKMASIGQLAAGVAHEINNPVGFIKSNLSTLEKYVGRLKQYLDLQQEQLVDHASAEVQELIKSEAKKLKIAYLLEDAPDLIHESLDGAERVKTIVQNLKTFSRVDQTEYSETDINECLESTINIVWNELKYKVTLSRDYADLPPIKCYPQQLNQVFMNILVNGAQAIESKGEMAVKTFLSEDFVKVRISDNGCGIPAENLERIFEPFFTTKAVGKGTGLGMSISYEIIHKHGGELEVESRVGEGTSFIISLPLKGAPPPTEDNDQ